jgi:cytoplasmic iron level regulating protein YaaA (DUF328/UPF0246 family)
LLPPSKGQVSGGRGAPWTPDGSALDTEREAVMRALVATMQRSSRATLSKLLDARGETLDAAQAANLVVARVPTMPAIVRYDGVLYGELGYPALPVAARRRLDRSVLIFGALHGVVGARDPLPEHRLGFGASLSGLGRLASWWRPRITDALAERLAGTVVWDLLPGEHAVAWDPARVPMRRHLTVRFLDAQGRTVSHWNKLLKGALVAHLAREGFADPAVLESFTHPTGYCWDPDATLTDERRTTYVMRAAG